MPAGRIKVVKFVNDSGSRAWRVSGTINGERIRRNFKTREEAIAERQVLEIKRKNTAQDLKTIATRLTPEQNREAEHAFRMLQGRNPSLTFAVQYLLEHYREPETEKSLSDAIQEYFDKRSRDEEKGIISYPQYQTIRKELRRFDEAFSGVLLGEITSAAINELLEGKDISLKTWNNRRGYLNTFFRFCQDRNWRTENPIDKVAHHRIRGRRGTAETQTAKQAESLMRFLETYDGLTDRQHKSGAEGKPGVLVNFFALCLFAGIRPDWKDGEISKLRSEDIDVETGVILIEPQVSKVNEKRTVQIQPNLDQWLRRYPLSEYPIFSLGFPRMYKDVRQSFSLGHDVLRHTFISMLVGKFRSVGDASLQAGNSEAVIRRYYLDVKSVAEAESFWNVYPTTDERKLLQFGG